MTIHNMALIDKNLWGSYWYSLTSKWDFSITEDEVSILSAAQNRILSEVWSWIFDNDYWSLLTELSATPIQLITESQIKWYVDLALRPMIEDSRILKITSIRITDRTEDSIQVEIKIALVNAEWTLDINLRL